MTVTLHWWIFPLIFIVAGITASVIVGRHARDFDFVTPIIAFGLFLMGIVSAIVFLLGRFLR